MLKIKLKTRKIIIKLGERIRRGSSLRWTPRWVHLSSVHRWSIPDDKTRPVIAPNYNTPLKSEAYPSQYLLPNTQKSILIKQILQF